MTTISTIPVATITIPSVLPKKKIRKMIKINKSKINNEFLSSSEESGSEVDNVIEPSDAEGGSATDDIVLSDDSPAEEAEVEAVVSPIEGTAPVAEVEAITTEKIKEKIIKYTQEEIDIVNKITEEGSATIVLTRRQLDIAIEQERIKSKGGGKRGTKASFKTFGQFDKCYFLELQKQYRQVSGAEYTLQAFQSAIDYYMFKTINIGNAYCRSGFIKMGGRDGTKEVGVNMPQGFWDNDFLNGFLNTMEGKEQLEVAEESMRVKRKTTSNTKNTNKTKEGRAKNIADALSVMSEEERAELIAKLMGGSK